MKVKICGLTTHEHVDTSVCAGADYLGFVFAKSRRQVTAQKVKEITTNVPKAVKKVGVFVSPNALEVEQIIQDAGLDLVQIHGEPMKEQVSVPVSQAYSVQETDGASQNEYCPSKFLLFDAPPQKFEGGNGQAFDWRKLNLSSEDRCRSFIAGGLNEQNVHLARRLFRPYAVDVSSGVETSGKKDSQKIYRFIQKAKEEFDV